MLGSKEYLKVKKVSWRHLNEILVHNISPFGQPNHPGPCRCHSCSAKEKIVSFGHSLKSKNAPIFKKVIFEFGTLPISSGVYFDPRLDVHWHNLLSVWCILSCGCCRAVFSNFPRTAVQNGSPVVELFCTQTFETNFRSNVGKWIMKS